MKKLFCAVMALIMTFTLAACGGTQAQPDRGVPNPPSVPAESTPTIPPETEPTAAPEEGGTLIAYFSWSGNTETLANMIAEQTGGDLFIIEPQTPYTDDYDTLMDVAQEEQRDNARPALAAEVENWADYDTIFVGYPNWWSDAPMAVLSFLESYDCTGKTIVPFATSASGGFGRSLTSVEASAVGATILEGLHVSGSQVDGAADDVAEWLDGLGLGQ